MRLESSITSISWIPREAVSGLLRLPFDLGIGHYDMPPPDHLEDLDALREADRFRFANELRAWIEVDDGKVVDAGYSGGGHIGSTTLNLGVAHLTFAAVPFDDIQRPPEIRDGSARFVQTAGGRTGAPAPRPVSRPPYVQITSSTAWTTLGLTIHADGRTEHELVGASPFPRHWVYDNDGNLALKSGLIDFTEWSKEDFGDHTPWGGMDVSPVVTGFESALEREVSAQIMRKDTRAKSRKIGEGDTLVEQGDEGKEIFLLQDGILVVEIDGQPVVEVGPGTILGERAVVESGVRTATLRAATPVRVAVVLPDQVDRAALERIAARRRGEAKS